MAKKYIDADRLKQTIADNVYLVQDAFNSRDYGMFWTGGIEKAIDEQPAVNIEPRWIPVTERLPEQEGQYLVCCNNKHHRFEVARFYINYDGDRWFCCDWNNPDDIEAWMPLPEPYKGGEEE